MQGSPDVTENYMGTDTLDDCPDDSDDDAWPPDINNDTSCNVFDLMEYIASGALVESLSSFITRATETR